MASGNVHSAAEQAMAEVQLEIDRCDLAIKKASRRKKTVSRECDAEIKRQRQHKKEWAEKMKALAEDLEASKAQERQRMYRSLDGGMMSPALMPYQLFSNSYSWFKLHELSAWAKWTIDKLYSRALDDEDWQVELLKCVPEKDADYIYVDDVPQGIPHDMQHLSDFITHVLSDQSEKCPILQPWDHKFNEDVQLTWQTWMAECPFLQPLEELLQFKFDDEDDDDNGRDICRRFPRDGWSMVAVAARKWIDKKTFPNWPLFAAAILIEMRNWTPEDE